MITGGLMFLLGIAFSGATIFASVAPFGPAFAASAPKKHLTPAIAGTVIGYALNMASVSTMKYVAALALVFLLRKLWKEREGNWQRSLSAVVIAAASVLLPSALLTLYLGGTPFNIIMTVAESVLAGTAAFFLVRTGEALSLRRSLSLLRAADLAAVLLCFCILVIALGSFQIAGFSVGRCLVCLALLVLAQFGRESAGAIYGLCAGIALTLYDNSLGYYLAAWGFGGLIAGVFAAVGRFGTALGFLLVNTVTAIVTGQPFSFMMFYETAAACVVFLLVPPSLMEHLRPYVSRKSAEEPDAQRFPTVFRLQYAGESLRDIGQAVDKVTQKLGEITGEDLGYLVDRTADDVCSGCERQNVCWNQRYDETTRHFHELLELLKNTPNPSLEQFPADFLEDCRHPKVVAGALSERYRVHQRQLGAERRIASVRSVVADQFDGMGDLLTELARRYAEVDSYDTRTSEQIVGYLTKKGIAVSAALCFADNAGRVHVEVCVDRSAFRRLDVGDLGVLISRLCDCRMELADVSETARHQKLLFLQEAVYSIDFGVCQIAAGGQKLCGDSYDYFNDEDGSAYVLLSDGMGSGGRAAVDSAMTCGLLSRLLRAGFPFDSAVGLVNAALLVKSGDESLATLDAACINLFSGRTELMKAGAAPSFLRRGGTTGAIAASSLPIGILGGVSVEKRSLTLGGGDILVQVSDGVTGEDCPWLESMLSLWRGPAAELARTIATEAQKRRMDGHEDDITAAVMIVKKGA